MDGKNNINSSLKANEISKSTPFLWGSGSHKVIRKHPSKKLHRSDMMLRNQIDVMKDVTKSINKIVEKLEFSNRLDSTVIQQILILERKAQHLKLVLEVLYKINLEIEFWRSKLYHSVTSHDAEAELIRQRILWLEHRLEKVVADNSSKKLLKKFQIPFALQGLTKDGLKTARKIDMLPSTVFPSFRKSTIIMKPAPEEEIVSYDMLDEGGRYWLSDHHRFAYTPDVKNLLQQNPLSYHKVGLAIPASYVDKPVSIAEIPWLTEQDPAKGNYDIMREDLEEVQKRIFQIHEKVYNAAKLSLNQDELFSPPTVKIQSVTVESDAISETPYNESIRDSNFLFPQQARSISAVSESRALSEYVAAGDVLPITRTNVSKKYPHACDHWSNMRPAEDGIDQQPIIVNQRDLRNKTKLKLFVSKRLKKKQHVERNLITPSSVTSNRSYRKGVPAIRFIENLKSDDGTILSDIQHERLNDLLSCLKNSPRVDDRVYAATSLSTLGATATEKALPALIHALGDINPAVRFGAAKALINLGKWHESALKELIVLLETKDHEVCIDILNTLSCSEQTRAVGLMIGDVPELAKLIKVVTPFLFSDDEELSFHAAVCLGEICADTDPNLTSTVKIKLLQVVESTSKWDWHSQALEVIVRRLKYFDEPILKAVITQLKHAVKWKDRLAAALLIAYAGPIKVFPLMNEKEVFDLFSPKLWDDPKRDVRQGVSQAFTSLGLRNQLLDNLDVQITNPNPEVRAHAVMAMSAVGIKSDKTLRSLIEMLGLDSSDYVRLQIMRTFHALTITDIRAVRALREREKSGGPLSREASKILASLDVRLTTGVSSVPRLSRRSQNQVGMMNRSETASSWFPSPWRGNRDSIATKQSQRRSRHGQHTSSSFRSSSDFASSPRYEIISTTGHRNRCSVADNRVPTAETHVSTISSFF